MSNVVGFNALMGTLERMSGRIRSGRTGEACTRLSRVDLAVSKEEDMTLNLVSAVILAASLSISSSPEGAAPDDGVVHTPADGVAVEKLERDGQVWYVSGSARVTTKLPVGYPAPTAPGYVELKTYPQVRRAVVSSDADLSRGSGRQTSRAFFPLFRHIQERNISMTAPVEMDYESLGRDEGVGSWSMAFLYEEQEMGLTGEDGIVRVEDAPPVRVISMGAQGAYTIANYQRTLEALEAVLAEQEGLVAAGPARVLNYNGPGRPPSMFWYEVQIPVEVAGLSDDRSPDDVKDHTDLKPAPTILPGEL